MDKILVVIPYAIRNKDNALRTQEIMCKRNPRTPFDVMLIEDINKDYYFTILNEVWTKKSKEYDWIVYAQDDLFPGNSWLNIALEAARLTNKKFIAFNDGKWF